MAPPIEILSHAAYHPFNSEQREVIELGTAPVALQESSKVFLTHLESASQAEGKSSYSVQSVYVGISSQELSSVFQAQPKSFAPAPGAAVIALQVAASAEP